MTTKLQKQEKLIELKSISFQLIQKKMDFLIRFKWAKLLILFFLILGSNESIYSQTDEVMEGAVYFKIKPSTNIHLPTYNTSYSGTYPYFNHLISQFGITDIYKPFKHLDSVYFGYTYRIYLNKSADIYQLIDSLDNYGFVDYSEPIALYRTSYTPSDSLYNKQYYVNLIKADKVWNTTLGNSNVKIAVIDDGFRLTHNDLVGQMYVNPNEILDGIDNDNNGYIDDVNGWDGVDNDNNPSIPANLWNTSNFNHGTMVLGTMAAKHNNSGISGIAPNCKFIPLKSKPDADSSFRGNLFIDDCLAYVTMIRPDIVNMSLGSYQIGPNLTQRSLIRYGDSLGVLYVVAAGNENNRFLNVRYSRGNFYPAAYKEVISVAAVDSNDIKSSFSNYGGLAGVDISAPGSSIITCSASNDYDVDVVNGTSFACPITSAVCALIKSQNPTFSNTDIKNCLYNSADKIDMLNDREFTGALGVGRVNALGAINCSPNYNAHFTCLQGRLVGCTDSIFSFKSTQYSNVEYHWTINSTTSINTYNNSRLNYQFAKAGVYSIQLDIVDLSNNVLDRKKYYNYISVKPCEEIKNKSNNVWHFGNKASLNFNDNSVKQRFDNQINYRGSNSIINDYNGRYLNSDDYVYAGWGEGIQTYDSNFNAIDPFSTLSGGGNSIDFSKSKTNLMFVPDINKENDVIGIASTVNNYYNFSTWSSFYPALRLTAFKILNNNSSDSFYKFYQDSSFSNINYFPASDSSIFTMDGIAVVPQDTCNGYWFYVQTYNENEGTANNTLLQYSLSNNYEFDLVNTYYLPACGNISTMKLSKDGSKLGIFNDCNYRVYIFNVNRTNGVLTLIDSVKSIYNYFEFSPNGEIIYANDNRKNSPSIYQYELKNDYDSGVYVTNFSIWDNLNLKLAPDNTIYINTSEKDYLSAITFPDSVITDVTKNQVGYIKRSIELNYKQSTNTRDTLIHSGFGLPQTLNDLNECLIDIMPIIENCDSIMVTTNACGNSFNWQLNGLIKTGRTVTFYNPNLNTDTVYLTVRGKRVKYKPQLPPPVLNNDSLVIFTVPGTPAYLQKTNSISYADYQWFKDGRHVYGCPTCSTYSTDKVGVYKVVSSSTCGQSVSNTVEIKYNCNSLAINRTYYQPVGYNFNSGITNIMAVSGTNAYLMKGKNIIGSGDSVYIQGTNILLESCAEIVVEKGGYLNVEYSNFVGCDNWQGITVLGDSSSFAGRNLGSSIHGSMYMKESSVSNANVGVYALNGGFVYLDSNEFISNAYHIGFNEYKHNDYSIVFRNKLYPCSEYHDKIIVKATGVQKLCSAGRDDIPSERKSYLFINKMKNTIIDLNYFIADIPYNDRHYNYYSAGIEVNNSKDLNINNNRFTNYFLNYDVYMKNTTNSSVNGNEFIANFYGAPILDNQGLTNGVYMKECDSMQVQYNKFHNNVNGLEIYNRTYKATNKIIGNSIRENYIGLLLAPEKNPTNAYTGDNVSADSMNQFIYCNKFFDNKNGMVGSGNLRYQTGYNGDDWACKLDGNTNWDILWDGRCYVSHVSSTKYNQRGQTTYPLFLNQVLIDSNKNSLIDDNDFSNIPDPCGLNLKRQILNLRNEKISTSQIVLYPNPFEDVIYIKGLLDNANYQIKITDMNGKIIKIDFQINMDNASIDLRNLTKGIYTVTISSNDKIENVKIIKL